MKKLAIILGSIAAIGANAYAVQSPIPGAANGAWVYDADGVHGGRAQAIIDYNQKQRMIGAPTVNMIFNYGADMEMYCRGGVANCTPDQMQVYYTMSGQPNTAAYKNALLSIKNLMMSPIIDGRFDAYLKGFDALSPTKARTYADNVAKQVCADPNVDGIQFDLEPFNLQKNNGEYYFYKEIAKDFSGANDASLGITCRDNSHPNGRYFSVFTFASDVNSAVAEVFRYNGVEYGYVIDSLYDLGPLAPGHANPIEDYKKYVKVEADAMAQKAQQLGIKYQYAIPAAASVHEFEGTLDSNHTVHKTGQHQVEYVMAARQAIVSALKQYGRMGYIGTDIWSFEDRGADVWGGVSFVPDTAVNDAP